MKVIIRYLIIISGMAPFELLPYVSPLFLGGKYVLKKPKHFSGQTGYFIPGKSATGEAA